MTPLEWCLAALAVGLGTYVLRAAPFLWRPLYELGRRHVRFLTYVSFAIAAGIVSKALFVDKGALLLTGDTVVKIGAVALALGLYRYIRVIPLVLFTSIAVAVIVRWWLV